MTTSENQRKMHRISADNPVRRRLFAADEDESKVDNFVNALQESTARDRLEKMKKWNFDFENEKPLEGTYAWYRADAEDPNDWIGIKSTEMNVCKSINEDENNLRVKIQNENTPKVRKEKADIQKLLIRKRKLNRLKNSVECAVRRRIDL